MRGGRGPCEAELEVGKLGWFWLGGWAAVAWTSIKCLGRYLACGGLIAVRSLVVYRCEVSSESSEC